MTAGLRSIGAVLTIAATALSLWSASPAAGQNCGEQSAAFTAVFDGLPEDLSVVPVCPADIGPGFADPKPTAQFSTLTAGQVTDTGISPDTDGKGGRLLLLLRNRAGRHPGRLRFRSRGCAARNESDHRRLRGRPLHPFRHIDIHPRRRRTAGR